VRGSRKALSWWRWENTSSVKKDSRTGFPQHGGGYAHFSCAIGGELVDNQVARFVRTMLHFSYQHLSHCLLTGISTRCSASDLWQKGRRMMLTVLVAGFPLWVRDALVSQVLQAAPGKHQPHTVGGLTSSLFCLFSKMFVWYDPGHLVA